MNDNNFFELAVEKCVKCGACVRDCAFGALKRDEEGRPIVSSAAKCMRCQHCFAICPTGAISIDGKKAEDALSTRELDVPSAKSVKNYLATRRSTRQFLDEDVSRETLDEIFSSLGNVPTGCNARALTFTCFSTREAMANFKKAFINAIEEHRDGTKMLPRSLAIPAIQMRRGKSDIFFRNAPGLVIISSDETNTSVTTPREDVAIACAYFEMLAQAHGLATCWCGFLKLVQETVPELLEKILGFRKATPFYAILFGKSAVNYKRGVLRNDYAKIIYK